MKSRVLGCALFALLTLPTLGHAAVLTFPNSQCSVNPNGSGAASACSNFLYINQAYGDAANVDITYKDLINTGSSLKWWDTNYSDLIGVAWGGNSDANGASSDRIEIKPLLGGTVTLNGFDLGAYPNTALNTQLRIVDLVTNAVLLNYSAQTIGTGGIHTHFSPNISSANGVAIEWRDSGYNVGIDNIDFTVGTGGTIPEPGSLALLGLGLLGLGFNRRKKN